MSEKEENKKDVWHSSRSSSIRGIEIILLGCEKDQLVDESRYLKGKKCNLPYIKRMLASNYLQKENPPEDTVNNYSNI